MTIVCTTGVVIREAECRLKLHANTSVVSKNYMLTEGEHSEIGQK